jgi:hypothetical protein
VPFFYFPTFEQQESAEQNRESLAAAGIVLGSTARWIHSDVCYAVGWAHGHIVYVAGEDIADAYAEGTLGPDDIRHRRRARRDPVCRRRASLAPSTPSSHVAVLAGDWGIPFVFLSQPELVDAAQALVGRDVIVRATPLSPRFFDGTHVDPATCQVRLVDVTDALDDAVAEHLRDLKRAPDLNLRPFVLSGAYSAEVETATPDDIVRIGGKAANYGFLRRAIPQNARIGIAFTFDLWSDYLDQPIDGGATLRERIATLLAPFSSYPPADFDALFGALGDVRDLIDDEADFTPAQKTAIIAALQRFNPDRLIRFRSSTNVEDSDVFTGAGLYESESGCLADDLDDDDEGPSRCDASRENERGVFRALRKVYQSFYNDNAYLERLRHRVDESTVGMAVLVNHTFTDDTELANGVATLRATSPTSATVSIVSQPGAFSVTNPEGDGLPEVVEVFVFGDTVIPSLRQGAERLPLGATVLDMPSEYAQLTNLLVAVGHAFGEFHGESEYNIEFEYKKITGEGLDLKQVRRLPDLTEAETQPVLINAPVQLCTFQAEHGDVFANYRLKSRWQPQFATGLIADDAPSFYVAAPHQYVDGGSVRELSGAPSTWPEATHASFDPQSPGVLGFAESWTVGTGASRRRMMLKTLVPTSVGPKRIPIVLPEDLGFSLEADYDTPVPYLDFNDTVAQRSEEDTLLYECGDQVPLTASHHLLNRAFTHGTVSIASNFYWPPTPTGAVAGYTAPLDRWVETTVNGVVSQPVVLHGYFSQTYRPEHHNFNENFIFDPHFEEGFDSAILTEWDAKGIQALFRPASSADPRWVRALTTDGRLEYLDELE